VSASAALEPDDGRPKPVESRPLTPEQEAEYAQIVGLFRNSTPDPEVVVKGSFLAIPQDGFMVAIPEIVAVFPGDEGYASILTRAGVVDARISAEGLVRQLGFGSDDSA